MAKNKSGKKPKKTDNLTTEMFQNESVNENVNQNHNIKKEALGPNTKR